MSTIAWVVSGLPSFMIANGRGGGGREAPGLIITRATGAANALLSGH
jgi:hypothetical protein